MASDTQWPQFKTGIAYASHSDLNSYQVCIPRPLEPSPEEQLWLVYIHGGAWYDFEQTASTFDAAQKLLLQSPSTLACLAGFASINYRLSAPPPSSTLPPPSPNDSARNAIHPDHIEDVLTAIAHIQRTYGFGSRYLLVGHSCGATLALQVAMKQDWGGATSTGSEKPVAPVAVLGVEGLYDLPALVSYHADISAYREFVTTAFGPDSEVWAAVSPAVSAEGLSQAHWPEGRLVVIAHSHEDELVEWEQVERMQQALKTQGFRSGAAGEASATRDCRQVGLLELHGGHDQVWEEGTELARAVEWTLQELVRLEGKKPEP